MDPTLPLWLTVVASALGGAGLTGLVTVATKVVDLRHRHDDTKRDRYVDFLNAVEALQQAVLDAVDAHNRRTFEDIPAEQMTTEQAVAIRAAFARANATASATSPLFAEARRAFMTVSLFAPQRVQVAAFDLMDAMADQYMPIVGSANANDPNPLPTPVWPEDKYEAYIFAVRADLGVGNKHRDRLHALTQRLRHRMEPAPDPVEPPTQA